MKNFKLSMLAMLSVIAMTFTSCLGDDGDNTQYVYGTGKALSAQSVLLDNGLTITSGSGTLELSQRYYIMAQCSQETYESVMAKLNAGERASMNSDYMQGGKFITGELEDESETSTEVESLSWFNWGAFGNGYVNLTVKADYYTKKAENNNTPSLFTPEVGATYEYDADANKLTLTVAYNSRKEEATDSDGKLKSGYSVYSGQELPVSIDVTRLYRVLKDEKPSLKDTDEINLVVKYLSEGEVQSAELTGKFGTSTNYFNLGMLKRNFEY